MPEREARSKNRPSADAARGGAGIVEGKCELCGEPFSDAAPGRLHVANGPSDRSYRAHAKCIHEKGMMARAMRQPQMP